MRRKRKPVCVQPTAIKRSRKMLGEPFMESNQDGNTVCLDVLTVKERGVIVVPKDIMKKMDCSGNGELVLMTMRCDGGMPIIMLIPSCRLFPDDKKRTSSKADHGPD